MKIIAVIFTSLYLLCESGRFIYEKVSLVFPRFLSASSFFIRLSHHVPGFFFFTSWFLVPVFYCCILLMCLFVCCCLCILFLGVLPSVILGNQSHVKNKLSLNNGDILQIHKKTARPVRTMIMTMMAMIMLRKLIIIVMIMTKNKINNIHMYVACASRRTQNQDKFTAQPLFPYTYYMTLLRSHKNRQQLNVYI